MPRIHRAGRSIVHRRPRQHGLERQQLTDAFMWTFRTFLVSIFVVLAFISLRMQIDYASRNTAIKDAIDQYSYVSPAAAETLALRGKVNNDEFFHKSPSAFDLSEHIQFDPPNWDTEKHKLKLHPVWNCNDDPTTRRNKVFYLHMSRSAGSTIRPLFRAYSKVCHRSIASIGICVDLGLESTSGNDEWQNGELSPYAATNCLLSGPTSREGDPIESQLNGRVSSQFLAENNFDVITGHLPLGSHAMWTEEQVLYVVMIRHPLARFVSEIIFRYGSEQMSIEELVSLVSRMTKSRLKAKKYRDSYSSYFITPEQMKWADVENIELTVELRTNWALNSLVSNKILVGLVERVPESLKMIQYTIDATYQADSLFEFFGSPTEMVNITKGNKRTQSVISAIEGDGNLSENLRELLKYELRFYSYAYQLHEHQYKWMLEVSGNNTYYA